MKFRLSRAAQRLEVNTRFTLRKTCFLFLTFYWLIMDHSILQCTMLSIQHIPAITNETRENVMVYGQES